MGQKKKQKSEAETGLNDKRSESFCYCFIISAEIRLIQQAGVFVLRGMKRRESPDQIECERVKEPEQKKSSLPHQTPARQAPITRRCFTKTLIVLAKESGGKKWPVKAEQRSARPPPRAFIQSSAC